MSSSRLVRARASSAAIVVSTVIAVCLVAAPALAATGARDAGAESQGLSDVNSARAANGRARLRLSDTLAKIARHHSQEMANAGYIYHSSDLQDQVKGWQLLGENVGEGPDMTSIDDAFMQSKPHRHNILDRYTLVGIGVVRAPDGTLYVTQVFELPESHHASTTTHHTTHRTSVTHRRVVHSVHRHHARTTRARLGAVRRARHKKVFEPDPMFATGTMAALEVLAGEW